MKGWLTFETSTLKTLYGGQFTTSPQLIKPNYLVVSLSNSTTISCKTSYLHSLFIKIVYNIIVNLASTLLCISMVYVLMNGAETGKVKGTESKNYIL